MKVEAKYYYVFQTICFDESTFALNDNYFIIKWLVENISFTIMRSTQKIPYKYIWVFSIMIFWNFDRLNECRRTLSNNMTLYFSYKSFAVVWRSLFVILLFNETLREIVFGQREDFSCSPLTWRIFVFMLIVERSNYNCIVQVFVQ